MMHGGSEKWASGWRRYVGGGAIAALSVILIFAAVELTVRIEDRLRWGTPMTASAVGLSDLTVVDEAGRHPLALSAYRKWKINSIGTRGPEPDSTGAAPRVLVLGASETFGLYESPDKEYPRQLGDSLRAAGCRVDVLNAAFPGMSLPTVHHDLRERLSKLRPAVVVYYPTPPQYLDIDPPVHVTPVAPGRPGAAASLRLIPRFRDQFKLMLPAVVQDRLRAAMIERARRDKDSTWLFTEVPADRLAAFELDLRKLVATIREIGAEPVLMTHANSFMTDTAPDENRLRSWERFYPRATGETLLAFESAAAGTVRRLAGELGVRLVDTETGFRTSTQGELFADFSHFTDAGAARMAMLMRAEISAAVGCVTQ